MEFLKAETEVQAVFIAPSVPKVSAYQSGFQCDELNTRKEVTGGNKAFSLQTECGIANGSIAYVLVQNLGAAALL